MFPFIGGNNAWYKIEGEGFLDAALIAIDDKSYPLFYKSEVRKLDTSFVVLGGHFLQTLK